MTSTASSQNNPAPNSSAASAPSYASAAGASKKPASTPLIATGSNQSTPVVVGGSSAQHAKSSGPSPVNGRPPITPAVPAPAAAHGSNNNSNNMNGAGEHSRKSSVTISANGPNSYAANGGAAGGGSKSGIQFGFKDSPAIAHSSPQMSAAPIPIPGGNQSARVPSPAHSPSPIPQPSASGGRPPSGIAQQGNMTFGSLGSDGDRHMRQASTPQNPAALASQPGAHIRRESAVSQQSDMSGAAGNRPNFTPQGGRGRGNTPYNPAHPPFNASQGFPPNFSLARPWPRGMPLHSTRLIAHGRGEVSCGEAPWTQASEEAALSGRNTGPLKATPSLHPDAPCFLIPPSHKSLLTQSPAKIDLSPESGNFERMLTAKQQYGYPPQGGQFDARQAPYYMPQPYMQQGPGGSPAGNYQQGFVPPPYHTAAPVSMSRTSSHSERPTSSTGQPSQPVIVSGAPQQNAQGKGAAALPFTRPKKSAAVVIKNAQGETVDFSSMKTPASPSPSTQQTRTPPVIATTPSPAPKSATPARPDHNRTESAPKTAKEIQEELRAKVLLAAGGESKDTKTAKPEPAKTEVKPVEAAPVTEAKKEVTEAPKAAEEPAAEATKKEEPKATKEAESKPAEPAANVESEETRWSSPTPSRARGAQEVGDVTDKLASLNIGDKSSKAAPAEKARATKPAALNLAPINTKPVEPPQPSAALQSLKSARFLTVINQDIYPAGISSPNPALNAAVAKKGKTFKYDAQFLLQFQKVFTEQPSMEFHHQVKALIGEDGSRSASSPRPGSSRQPSRSGAFTPSQPNMGQFISNPSVRGTTSKQRFAMSNAALASGATAPAAGGMGSFGRTGSGFPMGPPISPNASSSNINPSNSRRGPGGSQRGNSRRDNFGAKEAQAAKTMPLTQGMDLKPITVSSSGWKPTSLGKGPAAAAPTGNMDPEMVQRKVKAALNKMTPEKFDKIADQILTIVAQSKTESDGRTLRQVIQLTFEKATDEAHWASMYAKFCKRMLDTMSHEIRDENLKDKNGEVVSGGALFRKYLLNRCQEEFERGWKVNIPAKPEEAEEENKISAEAAMLSDEYYIAAAAKRRGLGLVQFIGELYKLGMLTERIMHACVQKLVDYETTPEEAEIESLCKLLRTIGANLDASPKGKSIMDAYFDRIQNVVNMPDLPSRLKFMLMDVVDMRRSGWATKEANKGPKTLDEAEAAAAQKAQENARGGSQRGAPGGRPHFGRGDARSFSNYTQQQSNQVGMDDLRRLKGATSRAASGNVTLGPTSMFSSRSNSGRRLGPGGSLGRAGEDSNASSRTGTPPTTHTNAFSALANLDNDNPASPPSTAASPALSKAVPDSTAAKESK
ncbi:eukaryotic initiation factor 4F subunit p130 [Verticillium alfalfae VaMs.102]|uniref:Eukaryotic initiation factor 4F subunit p130 n=1 Tax=Verticillium alfalfae (strain VaMs.102 / ATCC MYA-4576 / FGSC 10136) TaxID=526221 RepID=C9SPX6_VERA1|nr:eukaryotic initiation factor 4F subunit p130 [Verticillium alfalfae VaMs.102]EEY20901.1 eukaryotic initiation factor 4F subunit p130 [Verticillium alfalfae VaMs.102]